MLKYENVDWACLEEVRDHKQGSAEKGNLGFDFIKGKKFLEELSSYSFPRNTTFYEGG